MAGRFFCLVGFFLLFLFFYKLYFLFATFINVTHHIIPMMACLCRKHIESNHGIAFMSPGFQIFIVLCLSIDCVHCILYQNGVFSTFLNTVLYSIRCGLEIQRHLL